MGLTLRTTVAALLLSLAACERAPFTTPRALGGRSYSAAQLNRGFHLYRKACRACHGDEGDGHGASAQGLWPPPRDLTQGLYKFGRVPAPGLPPDAELARILRNGLDGTGMLQWTLGNTDLDALLGYVKTFSPRWQKERAEEAVTAGTDPFAGQTDRAAIIARGEALYHGKAMCSTCHPAYATRARLFEINAALGNAAAPPYSDLMYSSRVKDTEYCWRWHPGPVSPVNDDRTCDEPVHAVPPDFLHDPLRAVRDVDRPRELFLTLAGGISGAGMPPWKGALPDEDLWAISHYVESLLQHRGSPAARTLADSLRADENQTWMPPR